MHRMKKRVGTKINENLWSDDKKLIQEIVYDLSIVIYPVNKGKAIIIVIEDCEAYLSKMQEQINNGDEGNILAKRNRRLS